jgi:DNA polymerase-1
VEVLTKLARSHELPALVLRHRTLAKLKSTYADALLEMIHAETGRIHTSFNQTVAATGRLSSSDPNLQNIPIRTEEGREIRKAFVPREGWTFLSADYSQIELRILAHCSEDPILIQAFKDDEDIHTRTAAEVFQVFPQMISDDLRRQAKAINFGIILRHERIRPGQGSWRSATRWPRPTSITIFPLSGRQGVYRQDHRDGPRHPSDQYPAGPYPTTAGYRQHQPQCTPVCRAHRHQHPHPGYRCGPDQAGHDQRGPGAAKKRMKTTMLLSVHDEIIFEVPPEEIDDANALVREEMEGVWDLAVPLKVNVACGQNWAEAH